MGGRGSSGGFGGRNSVFEKKAELKTIETTYRMKSRLAWGGGGHYSDKVLEAIDKGNGEISFYYADPVSRVQTGSNSQKVTYELKAGAVNGKTFGINWSNVKMVSGQTYDISTDAKKNGLVWNPKLKKWVRKS